MTSKNIREIENEILFAKNTKVTEKTEEFELIPQEIEKNVNEEKVTDEQNAPPITDEEKVTDEQNAPPVTDEVEVTDDSIKNENSNYCYASFDEAYDFALNKMLQDNSIFKFEINSSNCPIYYGESGQIKN